MVFLSCQRHPCLCYPACFVHMSLPNRETLAAANAAVGEESPSGDMKA